ncbi:pyridoxal 5'-phosphate synthase subunit PdxT [Tepiditoga spiralis]|uniref:Pyridoxal 5'-phosphate synthase subunit PdxT n=1 Tax=Tepiditoga spiralis TaxID=2108365 RepID=A0A7G1G147_9BACT|nr:pyridoxal 5'-phosphate synthase glutaminase subunit PdxT [Tepiditoga spiralis]BBE29961.1 pyridoxal 5'-phosphate synthase subunit PdxT [Tepiditoga spiralis]
MKKVGVLDLQGGVEEHINLLDKIDNVESIRIKKAEQIDSIDALILPGGESTTMSKLIKKYNLSEKIKNFKGPIWGTCAGLILLSKKIENDEKTETLKLLDITVKRNAFGSQLNSFIKKEKISVLQYPFEMVFIRAPIISKTNNNVEIIAKTNDKIVGIKQGNIIGTSFHPELTNDKSFHEYFLSLIK